VVEAGRPTPATSPGKQPGLPIAYPRRGRANNRLIETRTVSALSDGAVEPFDIVHDDLPSHVPVGLGGAELDVPTEAPGAPTGTYTSLSEVIVRSRLPSAALLIPRATPTSRPDR
jgi:hypothetical protein